MSPNDPDPGAWRREQDRLADLQRRSEQLQRTTGLIGRAVTFTGVAVLIGAAAALFTGLRSNDTVGTPSDDAPAVVVELDSTLTAYDVDADGTVDALHVTGADTVQLIPTERSTPLWVTLLTGSGPLAAAIVALIALFVSQRHSTTT